MLALRSEVFAATLPHEAASVEHGSHVDVERLRVVDVFSVVMELRSRSFAEKTEKRAPVAYPTWVATAWQVLGWPEPSARLFWEMAWLVGDHAEAATEALDGEVEATDLALFLFLHCRRDAAVRDVDAPSVFEEAWIESTKQKKVNDYANNNGENSGHHHHHHNHHGSSHSSDEAETPPTSPPTSPRTHHRSVSKHASLDLCLEARAAAEAARKDWIKERTDVVARLVASAVRSPTLDAAGDHIVDPETFIVHKRDVDHLAFLLRPAVATKRNNHNSDSSSSGESSSSSSSRKVYFQRRRRPSDGKKQTRFSRRDVVSERCPLFSGKDEVDGAKFASWLAAALVDDETPLFAGKKMFGSDHHTSNRSFVCTARKAAIHGTIAIVDARRCTRLVVDSEPLPSGGDDDHLEDDDDDVDDLFLDDDEQQTVANDNKRKKKKKREPLFDCRVVGCRDARAYVLTATRYVDIVGCSDCLVVIGAAARLVRVIACERTHVVAAAGRALVSSCLSCRFSLYSPFAPLLDGDNRSCRVAPLALVYDGFRSHLRSAGLLREDRGLVSSLLENAASRRPTVESPLSFKSQNDDRDVDRDVDFAMAAGAAVAAAKSSSTTKNAWVLASGQEPTTSSTSDGNNQNDDDDDDARSEARSEARSKDSSDDPQSRGISGTSSVGHPRRARLSAFGGNASSSDADQDQTANLWRSPLRLAAGVHRGCDFARFATESLCLPPSDFDIVTTPLGTQQETQLPLKLPADYAAALEAKQHRAATARDRLKDASRSLDPEAQTKLQAVAKAAFAKWLVDSRAIRHVAELLFLEDDRKHHPHQAPPARGAAPHGFLLPNFPGES